MIPLTKKLLKVTGGYAHWCPGCEGIHIFATEEPYKFLWGFNGDLNFPTFTPSLLITFTRYAGGSIHEEVICHTFTRQGSIEYLNDCTHAYAGKIIAIPDIPADYL